MKASFWTTAGVALLSLGGYSPASGQTVEAGTYYETSSTSNCTSISFCYINFPQLPASKLVRFEKVNCRIVVDEDITVSYIGVSDAALTSLKRFIPVKVEIFLERDNKKYFSIESDVNFLAGQGKYVRVYFETFGSAISTNRCTLIGKTMTGVPTD